jgi:hypothetical protein
MTMPTDEWSPAAPGRPACGPARDPVAGPESETAPSSETTRSRRFGVYDAMISIGGIALLLTYGKREFISLFYQFMALCRTIAAYYGLTSTRPAPPQFLLNDMVLYTLDVLWYGVQASERALLVMTLAFLLMRVGRPRPSVRALLRQPGTVAGLAVAFGFIWVTGWLHRLFFGRITDGTVTPIAVGGTVAVAWACLALSRRWEPEPSWVDRMGRRLGAMAIIVGVIALLVFGI